MMRGSYSNLINEELRCLVGMEIVHRGGEADHRTSVQGHHQVHAWIPEEFCRPGGIEGGIKDNVLPSRARAVVNFRILPGDSVASVVAHVRRVVNDTAVHVRAMEGFSSEPSPVSRTDGEPYRVLERSIRQAAPDAVVAPYLVLGGTDARHYHALSEHVYRFLPVRMTSEDLDRIHGTDERISVRDYEAGIRFYRQLLLNAATR